jgi:hypothetical protein
MYIHGAPPGELVVERSLRPIVAREFPLELLPLHIWSNHAPGQSNLIVLSVQKDCLLEDRAFLTGETSCIRAT